MSYSLPRYLSEGGGGGVWYKDILLPGQSPLSEHFLNLYERSRVSTRGFENSIYGRMLIRDSVLFLERFNKYKIRKLKSKISRL